MAGHETMEFFDSKFLRKLETLAIFSRKAFAGRLRGEQRSNKHGSSVEFADFRPYSQGDDFRRIDWNAYARFEDLFVKLFSEEEDLFVYLLVDRSASMGFGEPTTKFDLARRVTAAVAYIALGHLDRVHVQAMSYDDPASTTAPPTEVAPNDGGRGNSADRMEEHLAFVRGKGSIFSIFNFLRQLRPQGQTDLGRSVRDFLIHNSHKGVAVVISDFLSPSGYEEPLKQLASAGFQPMVIQILSPEELDPQLSGDFQLVDSETGRPIDISTTRRMIDGYRDRVKLFTEGLAQFCKSRNMAHLQTPSDVAFEELILNYLRRAAMVK
ncbi:MAG: DUF58 domain-containing protein [Anaerolineaceae bacterium]|nr:DUF58 domain-containing protein [Anaerolineaceae bacterium]